LSVLDKLVSFAKGTDINRSLTFCQEYLAKPDLSLRELEGLLADLVRLRNLTNEWAASDIGAQWFGGTRFRQTLRARGGKLYNDDRIRVWHMQSLGVWGNCMIHFHDGRTLADFKRARLPVGLWIVHLFKTLLLPI